MPRTPRTPAPRPKSLPQQKSDFTAEGAPSVDQMAGLAPPERAAKRPAASRTPANIPGGHRRAPTGRKP